MTFSRVARCGLALGAAAVLGACASVPQPTVGEPGTSLAGRLSLRVEPAAGEAARSVSAAFELQGNAERGSLALDTPLGTTLALARWQPGAVTLNTPQGASSHTDLAALTREVLGEELPVAALFDWLRGRPWAGAESTPVAEPATGFSQLGWQVDLSRYAQAWVIAQRVRPPVVTVRIKLDAP